MALGEVEVEVEKGSFSGGVEGGEGFWRSQAVDHCAEPIAVRTVESDCCGVVCGSGLLCRRAGAGVADVDAVVGDGIGAGVDAVATGGGAGVSAGDRAVEPRAWSWR
eukprot:8619510-Pyramimonas_sp.AAC.1